MGLNRFKNALYKKKISFGLISLLDSPFTLNGYAKFEVYCYLDLPVLCFVN